MLGRTYEGQRCSIARSLEVVGERWSLLILRDVLVGLRRFDELHKSLGITRSVLSTRLEHLVCEGVLERSRYQTRPDRYEYLPIDKGLELWPVLMPCSTGATGTTPTSPGRPVSSSTPAAAAG